MPKKQIDQRVAQGLDWLDKEIHKDELQNKSEKEKMIREIKSIDRSQMVASKPKVVVKKKKSFIKKLLIVFGNG